MNNSHNKQKKQLWQIVRGICIICVVMIHCPDASEYGIKSMEFWSWMAIRQIIDFAVAVFIFMSGFFVNVDLCENNYLSYVKSRVGRLLVPYIIWSLFYTMIKLLTDISKSESVELIKIILRLLTGRAAKPFYYIIVLLQLMILTPYLIKIIKKNGLVSRLLWFVTPLYLIFVYYINIFTNIRFVLITTLFPAWFIFFYLGLNIKINSKKWDKIAETIGKKRIIMITLLCCLIEALLLQKIGCNASFSASQIKLSSFTYSFVIILYLYKQSQQLKSKNGRFVVFTKLLTYIGDYSYSIFFTHCFTLMIAETLLGIFSADVSWEIDFIVSWVISLTFSLMIVSILNFGLLQTNRGKKVLTMIGFN